LNAPIEIKEEAQMDTLYQVITSAQKENEISISAKKKKGLTRRFAQRPRMIHLVRQIEKSWEKYAFTHSQESQKKLIELLENTIKSMARWWGIRWNNCKLSAADFESIFFFEAWKLCDDYNHYTEFYFYETLLLILNRRAIDLVRKNTKTKQGAFELAVRPLKEEAEDYIPDKSVDVENQVTDRIIVAQILNDSTLTDKERELLKAKYLNPDASMAELASHVGLKHHEEVRRLFKRIRLKTAHYLN
jgi:DNA-directed RNA polymerase specialized sigma24 family protein